MRYFLPITKKQRTVNRYQFNKEYILSDSNVQTYWTSSYACSSSTITSQQYLVWRHVNNFIRNNYHYISILQDGEGNKNYLTFEGVVFPEQYFGLDANNIIEVKAQSFYVIQPYKFMCGDGILQSQLQLFNNSITSTIDDYGVLRNDSSNITGMWLADIHSLLMFQQPQSDISITITAINHINEYEVYCIIPSSQFNKTSNISTYDNSRSRISTTITPYITSIGLYNDNNQLLAIGKLSYPVRKSNKIDMIFNIQFDFN